MPVTSVIDDIFRTFAEYGHRRYGEHVTELAHALQCAHLAREAGDTSALIAACLLHDLGHLLHDEGEDAADLGHNTCHEELGAHHLSAWFGPEVVEPIRLHVAAKRYLCRRDPQYAGGLSEASRLSLRLQGGVMTEDEANRFEQHPHAAGAIRVRRYDDAGKRADLVPPPLDTYRGLLTSLLLQ